MDHCRITTMLTANWSQYATESQRLECTHFRLIGTPVVREFGWPPQRARTIVLCDRTAAASARRRRFALAGAGVNADLLLPVTFPARFFAMTCVDNVDAASAGLGDLVLSG